MARYGRTRTTAKYGDTWGSLSKRTGVPVTDLVKANKALKPIAGVKIIVPKSGLKPQVAGPTAPPTLPGSTGGGGGGGDKKYKQENGKYFYKFNKSGRDHEQGDWLPTTAYDAWKGEPDSHWAFNGRNWYGAKGKPQGPQWKPGKTPLPYGGGPPPNWSVGTKYMLDPEKGTYYYWSTYDWAWKVGGAKKKGRGGGGGGGNSAYDEAPYRPPYDPNETQVSMPTLYETKPKIIDQPTVNYQDAQGYQYGQPTAGNTLSYFNGPTLGYGNYGTTPGYNQGSLPSYIGLVNWRF